MPQRSLALEAVEAISLRRSPRFLHLKDSRTTPKPRSTNPFSLSSLSSTSNPRNGSTNSGKSAKGMKKFDVGSKNCGKSANGSRNCGNSTNGLRKTTRLSGNVEGIEGLRRSPRFRNKVNSSADLNVPLNRMFDGSDSCNDKSNRGSKKKLKENRAMLDFVDCPKTPIGVGEKKLMAVVGRGNESEISDSSGEIRVNLERRVTRSCSRLMGRKVEVGKISPSNQRGRNLFSNNVCESETRKVLGSLQSSAVRLGGEVKGIRCNKGKENRIDSCKGLIDGSKRIGSVPLSHCVKRGGRRGRRNNLADDREKDDKTDDSFKQIDGNLDRRITRSDSKQVGGENDLHCQTMVRRSTRISSTHVAGKAESIKAREGKQEGSGSFMYLGTEPRKRIQRSSVLSACVVEGEKNAAKGIEPKEKESDDCAEVDIPVRRDNKLTGVKRKREQVGFQEPYHGWTKEQEVALHKAYFTAKPSPHFWKKVSKLVPGKSAQECFDKVHSDNQTPLDTKSSSRAKKQNSPSDFLVSGSESFKSAETKSKKPCKKKCKSHVARKTVRQLLQKYYHANQDNEADLFSVLEPSVNPSTEALQLNAEQLTPKHFQRSPDLSSKFRDRSSSGHKMPLSRFSDRSASPLTSPLVLKKVKNMALHEKYIDKLHIREGKRKVAFSRCTKSARNQKDGEENSVHMKDIIKAAKEALVSNAKDAINKFHQSQVNTMEAFSDSEESLYSDKDEDETVL